MIVSNFFRIKIVLLKMNRFAKMEKQGKYTLFETLSALSGNYRIRVLSLG